MLSRVCIFKPTAVAAMRSQMKVAQLTQAPQRFFRPQSQRPGILNPYRHDPTPMSMDERAQQTVKPVWDRIFDHHKYMQHEGPLKVSSLIKNQQDTKF